MAGLSPHKVFKKHLDLSTLVLLFVLFITALGSYLRHLLEVQIHMSPEQVAMMEHVYKELALTGLISFALFVVETMGGVAQIAAFANVDPHELAIIFEYTHMGLLAVVMLYLLLTGFVMYVLANLVDLWSSWDSLSAVEAAKKHIRLLQHRPSSVHGSQAGSRRGSVHSLAGSARSGSGGRGSGGRGSGGKGRSGRGPMGRRARRIANRRGSAFSSVPSMASMKPTPRRSPRWLCLKEKHVPYWMRLRHSTNQLVFHIVKFDFIQQFAVDKSIMNRFNYLYYLKMALYEVCLDLVEVSWQTALLVVFIAVSRWVELKFLGENEELFRMVETLQFIGWSWGSMITVLLIRHELTTIMREFFIDDRKFSVERLQAFIQFSSAIYNEDQEAAAAAFEAGLTKRATLDTDALKSALSRTSDGNSAKDGSMHRTIELNAKDIPTTMKTSSLGHEQKLFNSKAIFRSAFDLNKVQRFVNGTSSSSTSDSSYSENDSEGSEEEHIEQVKLVGSLSQTGYRGSSKGSGLMQLPNQLPDGGAGVEKMPRKEEKPNEKLDEHVINIHRNNESKGSENDHGSASNGDDESDEKYYIHPILRTRVPVALKPKITGKSRSKTKDSSHPKDKHGPKDENKPKKESEDKKSSGDKSRDARRKKGHNSDENESRSSWSKGDASRKNSWRSRERKSSRPKKYNGCEDGANGTGASNASNAKPKLKLKSNDMDYDSSPPLSSRDSASPRSERRESANLFSPRRRQSGNTLQREGSVAELEASINSSHRNKRSNPASKHSGKSSAGHHGRACAGHSHSAFRKHMIEVKGSGPEDGAALKQALSQRRHRGDSNVSRANLTSGKIPVDGGTKPSHGAGDGNKESTTTWTGDQAMPEAIAEASETSESNDPHELEKRFWTGRPEFMLLVLQLVLVSDIFLLGSAVSTDYLMADSFLPLIVLTPIFVTLLCLPFVLRKYTMVTSLGALARIDLIVFALEPDGEDDVNDFVERHDVDTESVAPLPVNEHGEIVRRSSLESNLSVAQTFSTRLRASVDGIEGISNVQSPKGSKHKGSPRNTPTSGSGSKGRRNDFAKVLELTTMNRISQRSSKKKNGDTSAKKPSDKYKA